MMSTEFEIVDLTGIVGDIEIPCDYAEDDIGCPDDPATWVLHRVPCRCGNGGARLCCSTCKDYRLLSEGCVVCEACGAVFVPARTAYLFAEPLERRAK